MKTTPQSPLVPIRAALLLAGALDALAGQTQAAITATATLTDVAGAGNTYDYTLTLDNSVSSTSPRGSFWYGWTPGQFYLPTTPSSEGTPVNSHWTAAPFTLGGASSIQFHAASGFEIAPGGSLAFTFVTTDTPATLAGNSVTFGVPIGKSVAYSDDAFSANGLTFVVQSVPEPATLALLGLGSLGCLAAARRKCRTI